jgi:predicted transcriptional regulator of viral defense system
MNQTTLDILSAITALIPLGVVRARDMAERGVSRKQIMLLARAGLLVRVGRGLYSRPDAVITENHTLAQVCARVPHGVVCLASALQFHNLTTQNPWQVWLTIERHARAPRLEYPPLRILRAGGEAFTAGVETYAIEGVSVRVTCVAKTVVDCFKYRNKIGLEIALEALKECIRERQPDRASLHAYARICRVERVMQPYLEALAA